MSLGLSYERSLRRAVMLVLFAGLAWSFTKGSPDVRAGGGIKFLDAPVVTTGGFITALKWPRITISQYPSREERIFFANTEPDIIIDRKQGQFRQLRIGMEVNVSTYKKGTTPYDDCAFEIKATSKRRVK